jgi:hypothetical protein
MGGLSHSLIFLKFTVVFDDLPLKNSSKNMYITKNSHLIILKFDTVTTVLINHIPK